MPELVRNRLLRALPEAEFEELLPKLEARETLRGKAIELPGQPIQHAHFFEIGFASILIQVGGRTMEVGLVGREGMLGLPAVLGTKLAEYRAVVREDAVTRSIPVDELREFMQRKRVGTAVLLRYIQSGVAQITHMAFANTYLSIAQRLARWLLMAHDRIETDTVRVTHAILSEALGVQRPGVTIALGELERDCAIKTSQRSITILDRKRLIALAAGSYGPAEQAYKLLLGSAISKR